MGGAVNKVVEVGTLGLVDDFTGQEAAADAQRAAAGALSENIQRGMDLSAQEQQAIEGVLSQGQRQAISSLLAGKEDLLGGYQQAQQQIQPQAELFGPASNIMQRTGTAMGRGQAISDILADPNFAGFFDAVQERTGDQLSSAGLRRSGAGAQMSNEALLNAAMGLEADQYGRQSNLAQMGAAGTGTLASLLANQATAGYGADQNLASQYYGGAANMANVKQQGLANILNLMGQQGQAQAAGITGPAMTNLQANQGIFNLAGGIGGALLGGGF